jgi:hypothetical protein
LHEELLNDNLLSISFVVVSFTRSTCDGGLPAENVWRDATASLRSLHHKFMSCDHQNAVRHSTKQNTSCLRGLAILAMGVLLLAQQAAAFSSVVLGNYTIAGNASQWKSYLSRIDPEAIAAHVRSRNTTTNSSLNATSDALLIVWGQSPQAQAAAAFASSPQSRLTASTVTAWTASSTSSGAVFLHTSYVIVYLDGLYRTGSSADTRQFTVSTSGVDRASVIIFPSCPFQEAIFNSSSTATTPEQQRLPIICVQATPLLAVSVSLLQIVRLHLLMLMDQGIELFHHVGT